MEEARSSHTPTEPHFFKPLLPGFRQELLIPIAFLKYLNVKKGDEFDGEARLRTDYGEWHVGIRGGFLKGKRWTEFVEHHDLENGDFAVFKHLGDLLFSVTFYDTDGCEMEYTFPEDHHETQQKEDLNESRQQQLNNPSGACLKAEDCSLRFESSLQPYSCVYPKFLLPRGFTQVHGLYSRPCEVLIVDAEHAEKTWKMNLRQSKCGDMFFSSGWAVFRDANQLKVGERVSFELIRKGEKPVMVFRRVNGTSRAAVGRGKAKKLASQTPQTFTYKCNQTCLVTYELHIPKEIVVLMGISRDCEVIIKDPTGRHWPASLRHNGRRSFRISQGWEDVALANNLEIGDVIKLELVKSGETIEMNMSICCRSSERGGLYDGHPGGTVSVFLAS